MVGLTRDVLPVVLLAAAAPLGRPRAPGNGRALAEAAGLLGLFGLAPPLIAFAVYFGCWHPLRHLVRTIAAGAHRNSHGPAAETAAFARSAALPTAVSVVVLTAAWALGGASALSTGLVAVLCLTVPHSLTIARWDRSLTLPRTE